MKYLKLYEGFNQSEIDKILDKINKHGKKSLTWQEKRILEEPEDESHEAIGDDDLHFVMTALIMSNKVSGDNINIESDSRFELYSIKGKMFPYFEENWLNITVERDYDMGESEDGEICIYIEGEDTRDIDDPDELEVTTKERNQVFKWIEKNWVDKIPDINVYINDRDWEED